MKGLVRVAAITPKVSPADVGANEREIIALLEEAKKQGVALAVFPELALCGYTAGDLLFQSRLTDACAGAATRIAEHADGITAVVGMPAEAHGRLYNGAAVMSRGKIVALPLKIYGEGSRYFASGADIDEIALNGEKVSCGKGIVIEESKDLKFAFGVEIGSDADALCPPSQELVLGGAEIVCNPFAEAETSKSVGLRRVSVIERSARLKSGYISVGSGAGESTTDGVYSGHRLIAESGEMLGEGELFTEGMEITEIDVERLRFERKRARTFGAVSDGIRRVECSSNDFSDGIRRSIDKAPFLFKDDAEAERILDIQTQGLKKRMAASHSEKAIVGISGGLDSALALLIASRAVDSPSDVIAITMPCFGTSTRTRRNAEALSAALGADFREIPIAESVRRHFADIGHDMTLHDAAYENAQARERTQVLLDIANSVGGLVVGTGDMSELALGWATYNGDHISSYGVNASVPKTLVKQLVLYAARKYGGELGGVLVDIAATDISPELLPPDGKNIVQKTEDIIGKYVYHDFFIYYALGCGFAPDKVMYLALAAFGKSKKSEIKSAMKLFYSRFFSQQFKRSCMPDGAQVGSISLSPRGGLCMPSDAVAALWLDAVENL